MFVENWDSCDMAIMELSFKMIILSRKCCGACKPSVLDYISSLTSKFMPNIIILLETHMQLAKVCEVRCTLSMDYNVECIHLVDSSVGILLF